MATLQLVRASLGRACKQMALHLDLLVVVLFFVLVFGRVVAAVACTSSVVGTPTVFVLVVVAPVGLVQPRQQRRPRRVPVVGASLGSRCCLLRRCYCARLFVSSGDLGGKQSTTLAALILTLALAQIGKRQV